MAPRSIGERLDDLERRQVALDQQLDSTIHRVQYLDLVVRMLIKDFGVEKMQRMIDDETRRIAEVNMQEYAAEFDRMVEAKKLVRALEVRPHSFVLCSFLPAPDRVPEPRRIRASEAEALVGKMPGDIVGKYTILTIYDPVQS